MTCLVCNVWSQKEQEHEILLSDSLKMCVLMSFENNLCVHFVFEGNHSQSEKHVHKKVTKNFFAVKTRLNREVVAMKSFFRDLVIQRQKLRIRFRKIYSLNNI